MRYVIVGAGGVGGVIGGLLAAAGREVALVARGEHGDMIARDGLLLRRPDGDLRLRIPVAPTIERLGLTSDDAVVLAVKSQHTAALLDDLGAARAGGERAVDVLPLLCAQNGVANEDAALRLAPQVHGVCVNLPATHLQPGVVVGQGAPIAGVLPVGLAAGGTDDVDLAVAADLTAAGFTSEAVDDVLAWKRAKLLRNLGNALDALCGHDLADDEAAALAHVEGLVRAEGVAAYRAADLSFVEDAEYDASLRGYEARPVGGEERGGGSTWQSVARRQGSVETDWLNGEIARLGRLHGVPTPANALLQREMWRLVETGGLPGSRPPSALAAQLTA